MLIVSAAKGEFEAGISKNGSSREHVMLAYTLGVRQLIVAVNKMDSDTVDFDESRYNEVKTEMSAILKKVGFSPEKVPFVPISGFNGDNLTERCAKMGWYTGPTLIDAIDALTAPTRPNDKPLRLPIQDVYKIPGVGTVCTGRIESGTLSNGELIQIAPSNVVTDVKSIEIHHTAIPKAFCGDNVGFNVRNIAVKELKRGFVVGSAKDDAPLEAASFIAQIIVLNHPGEIRVGYTPIVDAHTSHVACKFNKLISKLDRRSGNVLEENPVSIKTGDSALVEVVPLKPMVVEVYSAYPQLGRFAIRDMKCTVAVGVVKEVTKKTPAKGTKKS